MTEEAEKFLGNDEVEPAIKRCSSAISIDHTCRDAYFLRAKAYAQKGEYNKVIDDCSKAISIDPSHGASYFIRGIIYADQKNHEKATKDFSKTIELKSNLELSYFKRASSYSRLQQRGKAIEDYSKVLLINPENINAYRQRGNCYILLADYIKAIEDLTCVLKREPDDIEALSSRGIAYALSGNIEKALPDLKIACENGDESACDVLKKIDGQTNVAKPLGADTTQKYTLLDFLRLNEVNTDGNYPAGEYMQFIKNFEHLSFDSPKIVKSISLSLAIPSTSRTCNALLYDCTIDEYDAYPVERKHKPIGKLQLTLWRDKGPKIDDVYFYKDSSLNSI